MEGKSIQNKIMMPTQRDQFAIVKKCKVLSVVYIYIYITQGQCIERRISEDISTIKQKPLLEDVQSKILSNCMPRTQKAFLSTI